jgi:alpha-glucosidase
MTWDETRVLQGEIGDYISTARRSGNQWFVASATNEEPRSLDIALDFLEPDCVYTATLYEDAPGAHYIENREAYQVRRIKVKRGDTIKASMAAGGGHCIHLQP